MRKFFVVLLLPVLMACSSPNINYLVNREKSMVLSKDSIISLLTRKGYEAFAPLMSTNVTLYKVTYTTEYPQGTFIQASGVIFVPDSLDAAFPTVVYTHGTCLQQEAPSLLADSVNKYNNGMLTALALASAYHCVVLEPDYIGYGASAFITHPYLHKVSLAQSCMDIIKAYRENAGKQALPFNNNIVVTGYSEGGYTAVALHEKIQETPAAGFTVKKTVAGSGPYDNTAIALELMTKSTDLNPVEVSSFLWVLEMFKTDYHYSKPYSDIFSEEDNALLKAQDYNLAYLAPVQYGLHSNPALLFKPELVTGVLDGTEQELLTISKENSLVEFAPKDSLIFVYGGADTWVYPVNTENAYNAMSAKGCKVKKYYDPAGTHPSVYALYLKVLMDSLNE